MAHATQQASSRAEHSSGQEYRLLEQQAAWHLEQASYHELSHAEAQRHLEQASIIADTLEMSGDNPALALNLKGRIALERGHFDTASKALRQALKIDPQNPGIHFSFGHLALAQQNLSEAAQYFRQAIQLDPNATIADQSLAYVRMRSGLYAEAFNDYRKLVVKYPSNHLLYARLLDCAGFIKADYFDAALASDVALLLQRPHINHQALAPLVGSLLIHKYDLSNPNVQIELSTLIHDQLLTLSLSKLTFLHVEVEDLLATLRQAVAMHLLELGDFDEGLTTLVTGLGWYSINNEYLLFQNSDEENLVAQLRSHIKEALQASVDLSEIALPVVILALYEPLYRNGLDLPKAAILDKAPEDYRALLNALLIAPAEELSRARSIKAITPIAGKVSKAVQAQYESNPYPRWRYLPPRSPALYPQAVATEIPAFQPKRFKPSKPLRVLVAGTGTGLHALHLAKHFRDVDVTAIDLSRRSLAYGMAKAKDHAATNLRFYQADILALADDSFHAPDGFDVIECSGVLHHMEDPLAGWQSLLRFLKSGGLMKVGLYSTRARQTLTRLRALIQQQGLEPTPRDIRRFRQALVEQKNSTDLSGILQSQDYYSMSGVRDLLFHVQEHCFTPLELAEMIESLPVEFLGFVLPPHVKRSYQHFFKDDALMNNLTNWERLEQDNPELFSGMYQFYIQKK